MSHICEFLKWKNEILSCCAVKIFLSTLWLNYFSFHFLSVIRIWRILFHSKSIRVKACKIWLRYTLHIFLCVSLNEETCWWNGGSLHFGIWYRLCIFHCQYLLSVNNVDTHRFAMSHQLLQIGKPLCTILSSSLPITRKSAESGTKYWGNFRHA